MRLLQESSRIQDLVMLSMNNSRNAYLLFYPFFRKRLLETTINSQLQQNHEHEINLIASAIFLADAKSGQIYCY